MTTEPLPIALLGAGIFASTQHLPAILSTPSLVLKAIYSRSASSARNLLVSASSSSSPHLDYDVSIYSDDDGGLTALLSRPDIAAVMIALPITVQPSVILQCLRAGKHVLSEKPIAPSISCALELLSVSKTTTTTTLWGVAENYRFQASWAYAREHISRLGRVLGFSVKMATLIDPVGNRYFHTSWRKTPEYQGGFILDGGVHFVAALRMLLGVENEVVKVSAFTACNRDYLLPVDTLNAVLKTRKGTTGSLMISFGSSERAFEFTVACEGGVVTCGGGGRVTVRDIEGKEEVKEFPDDRGIKQEFEAFAEGVRKGKIHPDQTPEEALKDLELVGVSLRWLWDHANSAPG
jgi:predicted dehydrogenase